MFNAHAHDMDRKETTTRLIRAQGLAFARSGRAGALESQAQVGRGWRGVWEAPKLASIH